VAVAVVLQPLVLQAQEAVAAMVAQVRHLQ
jgi:hypothetical protein